MAVAQEFPCGHLRFRPTTYKECPICRVDKRVRGRVTLMGNGKEKSIFHGMRKGRPGQVEARRKQRERKAGLA